MARRRAAWSSGVPAGSSGSASRRTRSAGMPACTEPWPSTEAASASLGGDRLLGVPGGALVGRPVHGGRHREPRVERRHGRVGAEGQLDAVVDHPAQREAPVGAVRPDQLGHVAVVEQVRGLHARDARRGGPSPSRRPGSSAGRARSNRGRPSPRTPPARRGRPRRRSRGSAVSQPVLGRPRHQLAQLGRRLVGGTGAGPVGVRVLAPRRSGVERTVADHLQRSHRQQVLALDERVARAQAGRR